MWNKRECARRAGHQLPEVPCSAFRYGVKRQMTFVNSRGGCVAVIRCVAGIGRCSNARLRQPTPLPSPAVCRIRPSGPSEESIYGAPLRRQLVSSTIFRNTSRRSTVHLLRVYRMRGKRTDRGRIGLLLKRCSHLFCRGDSICACNETARRILLTRNCNQCLCELGGVAGLLPVVAFQNSICFALRSL